MMKTVIHKLPKLLHGGDYNPDQWLDHPEVLAEDIELMKKAGVNTVSVGIFAWASLEPCEGVYDLDWLGEVIDRLYENGIYTVLATPTGAMPNWLTEKYEEVRQMGSSGVRNLSGKRHNFCYTSPVMREKTKKIDMELSRRFGKHPGVILWHISNEMGGNFTDGTCYCPLCQEKFRQWLKNKYKTLDALNTAWWTKFWSHTYTDWSQIHAPAPHGENLLHGLNLDWKRFSTEQLVDFYNEEVRAVRTNSDLPATTNMMGFFKDLDYCKFADSIDIAAWDAYPEWHSQKDEVDIAVWTAALHHQFRSLKKAPFLMMESTPSITNWKVNNIQKRPGMHELTSLQAIGLGSQSVQYFQWRKSRGSFEKFHGAVIGHTDHGNTRIFREVSRLGKRLHDISDEIYDTCNQPKTAFVFDWENWWSLEDAAGPKKEMAYVGTFLSHYKPFWEMGIDVDVVPMEDDFKDYQLVIAPMNYMYKPGYAEKIRRFVKEGGTYVATYFSGLVDDTDLCFIDRQPLDDVLGVSCEEIDSPNEFYKNHILYNGKKYDTGDLCEVLKVADAETLAVYEKDYYGGYPAVTVHTYGKGKAYYMACRTEEAFLKDFYGDIAAQCGLENGLTDRLPYGVTVSRRESDEKALYFVQNFNPAPVTVWLKGCFENIETGESVSGILQMSGYSCVILKKQIER